MRNPRLLLVILGLVALPLIALAVANTRPSHTATPSLSEQLAAWQRRHPDYTCSVTSQTDQTITADCEAIKSGSSAASVTVSVVSLRISNGSLHGAGFQFSSPSG